MVTYADIIYEYFDTSNSSDYLKLMAFNEQDQDRVLVNLAAKLYSHIVNEVDDIDFGGIPESRGDITKIPNYLDIMDCIKIIHDICLRFKQSTDATDTLFKAVDNLKATRSVWERSFNLKVGLGMNTYNSLAMAIVCGTSLLITTSIEYIKDPNSGEFDFVLDKVQHSKTAKSVLFQSLKEFNKGCTSGEFIKAVDVANNSKRNIAESELLSFDENAIMDAVLNAGRSVLSTVDSKNILSDGIKTGVGAVVGIAGGVILIAAVVIPAIRNAIHWFYSTKQKFSDYFAVQATLLEMNAANVKYNQSKSESERKSIYKKQMQLANRFKSLSNSLSVKMKKAETQAKNKLDTETSEKLTLSDVENTNKVSSLF